MGSCYEPAIFEPHSESVDLGVKKEFCVFVQIIESEFCVNFQVGQFRRLLGVKPRPRRDFESVPMVTHPKSLKLPKQFDARSAWPQCSTIGRILG